jgi:hypothetical protein
LSQVTAVGWSISRKGLTKPVMFGPGVEE